jgi:signal transduction histidine kinase
LSGSVSFIGELSQLGALLDQQRFSDYWQQSLEFILRCFRPSAASLRLLRRHAQVPGSTYRAGELMPELAMRIERWQGGLESYQGMVAGHNILDAVEIERGRQADEEPILHLRLGMDGVLHGGISFVFNDGEGALTAQDQLELLELTRSLAGSGLRALQLQATRQRLEHVSLVHQVSQSISSSLDLDTVLGDTTDLVQVVLNVQAATLFSLDERRSDLIFQIPTGSAGSMLRETRLPLRQGVAGWVATHGEAVIVNDTRQDPRFNSSVDAQTGFTTKNIMCVPLRVQKRIVGVLEVLNKEEDEGFTDDDLEWLSNVGTQVAIALENARLYENLRMEQERIIKAQEEVRHQLARDLHDGAAQMLSLIIMNVDVARRMLQRERFETVGSELDLLEDLARQANREIRTLLFELRPIILDSRGLPAALHAYHQQLSNSLDAAIHLELAELAFELLPKAAKNIFAVVQESINNIRKHAQARNIWIRLYTVDDTLCFEVEDDGRGFDREATQSNYDERGSFGLLNMKERMDMLGGQLRIESPSSRTDRGTRICGVVPVSRVMDQE